LPSLFCRFRRRMLNNMRTGRNLVLAFALFDASGVMLHRHQPTVKPMKKATLYPPDFLHPGHLLKQDLLQFIRRSATARKKQELKSALRRGTMGSSGLLH
jgi:hypothetical protein